jgi:hypothetical protein
MCVVLTRRTDVLTAGFTQLLAAADRIRGSCFVVGWYGFVRQQFVQRETSGPRAAKVAELADAPDLGSGSRKAVGVQVPPFAPDIFAPHS